MHGQTGRVGHLLRYLTAMMTLPIQYRCSLPLVLGTMEGYFCDNALELAWPKTNMSVSGRNASVAFVSCLSDTHCFYTSRSFIVSGLTCSKNPLNIGEVRWPLVHLWRSLTVDKLRYSSQPLGAWPRSLGLFRAYPRHLLSLMMPCYHILCVSYHSVEPPFQPSKIGTNLVLQKALKLVIKLWPNMFTFTVPLHLVLIVTVSHTWTPEVTFYAHWRLVFSRYTVKSSLSTTI